MNLTSQEVERFYNIWFPLLNYVNIQLKVVDFFPEKRSPQGTPLEIVFQLREALWADDTLRKGFIAENPANLSSEDIAIVESWEHRVSGEFFIYKHLKKYSVFLAGNENARAYGVLGITSSVKDTVGPYLPIYVRTVLIPFEERIVYDSLLSPYPIHFGGGYRQSLDHTYRHIQEREGILTSLHPATRIVQLDEIRSDYAAKNKKLTMIFQKHLGQSGLSPKMMQEHTQAIAVFGEEFLLQQVPPRLLLDTSLPDIKAYISATPGKVNMVSFKRFIQFLRDTDRIDYEQAEETLRYFKQQRSEK